MAIYRHMEPLLSLSRFTRRPLILSAFALLIGIPALGCADERRQDSLLFEKSFHLSVTDGLVTLEAREADLRKVLTELSAKTGAKIDIGPNLGGKLSTSLNNLTVEEVLKRISRNRGIVFSKEKGKERYKISRVAIFSSSQNGIKTMAEDQFAPSPETIRSAESSSQTIETGIPLRPSFSSTIVNELTGIRSQIVPDELVVRFHKDLDKKEMQALIARIGGKVKTHIKPLDYYVLSLPQALSVEDALYLFREQSVVDRVEPNYVIPIKTIPNDPDFSRQWALHNSGQTGGTEDADIDAAEAWSVEQGKAEVVIAIIDTGVDYAHEDLFGNIWHNPGEVAGNGVDDDGNGYVDDMLGWDFVHASGGAYDEDFQIPDNDPMDSHGHGTHVAGIAAAVTNNELGIAGVAWNSKIMPVRAGYRTPSGGGALESDDAAQAIIYAAKNGARVINLSWGQYQRSNLVDDAVTFATNKGVLICAAAGNENSSDPIYPAASENAAVLAVGATDSQDKKASFSNFGDWVHVSAPGVSIYSTHLKNEYTSRNGTSMATPHVAGVAALIFSYFPGLSPLEVKTRIMDSVDVLQDLEGQNVTGGRINAYGPLSEQFTTPRIFYLNSNAAHEGDEVTLLGTRFGSEQINGLVRFYPGINADVLSWSDSIIVCKVPEGAQTGDVTVTTSEGTSNRIEITILIKFYDQTLIENGFLGAGQAQGWHADDESWSYHLPFSFPFFGSHHGSVFISSNGFLDFTDSTPSYRNSAEDLETRVMIAPLWDDLITNGISQEGEDVYIHSPTTDSVSIRWVAERFGTTDPVNVEVILYEDGRIQFNYGSGNTNLSPTIGISGGNNNRYHMAVYDRNTRLDLVQTVLFRINPEAPPNQAPIADAGPDQTVVEGETVTLDGSNSSDIDDGIASFQWTQIAGTDVTFSNPNAAKPTFVAPPVDDDTDLTFQLTVTDNGGLQENDEVSITIQDNGITGFPPNLITMTSSTNKNIGIEDGEGGRCVSLYAIDPSTIDDNTDRPYNLIYGLIATEIKTDVVGGTAMLTYHLPDPADEDYTWYNYSATKGWIDFSANAVFNADRDQVTLTLVDGGAGDDDGDANGIIIVDASGLGAPPAGRAAASSAGAVAGSDGGGCFVASTAFGALPRDLAGFISKHHRLRSLVRWSRLLLFPSAPY